MLRFKGMELRPVLVEAIATKGRLILAKDQGVYFLAEFGERTPEGHQKLLAYAVGCNPDVDDFDDWWDLARVELGGDDFGEYFDPNENTFQHILNTEDDLVLSASPTHLTLYPVKPTSSSR